MQSLGEKFCGVDRFILQRSAVFGGQRASSNHASLPCSKNNPTFAESTASSQSARERSSPIQHNSPRALSCGAGWISNRPSLRWLHARSRAATRQGSLCCLSTQISTARSASTWPESRCAATTTTCSARAASAGGSRPTRRVLSTERR
jgi:hypothetical protein